MRVAKSKGRKEGILRANGGATAADADAPGAIAPIVVSPVVQRVKVVALSLPVLLIAAREGRGSLIAEE
jgi:hypothetical protein